jgi:carboxyl-terminal processing protease
MLSKPVRVILGLIVAIILLTGAFSGGILLGITVPDQAVASIPLPEFIKPAQAAQTASIDRENMFKPFWQAWDLVHRDYVDQPVNDQTLLYGAIRGMLASLGDQHTSYMDPDQYRQSNATLQGGYEGIGAYVDIKGDYVTIIAPIPGSPAETAGIKTGDMVIKVDGEDMTGIPGNLVLQRILGPAGTKVVLTIVRKDEPKPFDVSIVRAAIKMESVTGKMLDSNIAYISLNTFGDKTPADLHKILKDLLDKKPKGLILDLRNNTGGYLNAAIEIVSEFIPQGAVMYEQYGDGTKKTFEALGGGIAYDVPLVVLVNEGSASASEITAGAIQDLGRGKLVGVTTYGKGSVQNWTELQNHQGAVRITVARWLTPKERQINNVGLKPDFEIQFTEADVKDKKDPQLDKAIELLSK